jgi:DNA polymerase-1
MGNQQKIKNFTNTILKRKTFLNPYSTQHERNALNNPIQGSAADMIKLALIELHTHWDYDFPFSVVAVVHDEIVLDVPEQEAEKVKAFVKKATIKAANQMCSDIKMGFRADVVISSDWSEK